MEAVEQGPGAAVGLGVERDVGWPFRARNPASREHPAVVGVPDDDGSGAGAFEEADAAEDQRPHDPLAELGLRDQHVAEAIGRNDACVSSAVTARASTSDGRPGELRQLAHEPPGTVGDDRAIVSEHVVLGDRELAAQHDDHPRARLTRRHDPLACAVRARRSEAAQTLDLGGLQDREHLIVASLDR